MFEVPCGHVSHLMWLPRLAATEGKDCRMPVVPDEPKLQTQLSQGNLFLPVACSASVRISKGKPTSMRLCVSPTTGGIS